MKHNIYSIILASASILGLAGCEKESAFDLKPGEGQLNSGSLSVDYINRGKQTRADVQVGDFIVNFINTETNETARSFKYSEMPEVVALPVGSYRADAVYGDDAIAEWENPFYKGDSSFDIESGKITENVDPIECSLCNIRVTVDINDLGLGLLEDDAKVVVKAGIGELTYTPETKKAGYFRFVDKSTTIAAVFSGTVDGVYVEAVPMTFNNAAEGNSYNIHYTINRPDNVNPGDIEIGDTGITVDASITIRDENKEIDPNEPEDNLLEDDMRPIDGSGTGTGDEPGDDPTPSTNGPIIETVAPLQLNEEYPIEADESGLVALTPVQFTVTSETGITGFKIEIESDSLTPDELEAVGLTNNLDLINPRIIDKDSGEVILDYEAKLNNLGFPTGDNVKGQTFLEFDISQFVPLLIMLGNGEEAKHKFHLTVEDEKGPTTGTILLKSE